MSILGWAGTGLDIITILSKDEEHGPDNAGAKAGPEIDDGSGWRVVGRRWTLDKVFGA